MNTETLKAFPKPKKPLRHSEVPHVALPEEGWIFSYADMITILMTFFILLLSISNVSPEKYEKLTNAVSKETQSSIAPKPPQSNLKDLAKGSVLGAPQLAGIPLDVVAKKAAEYGGDRQAQLMEGVRILMTSADKQFAEQDLKQISEFEALKKEIEKMSNVTLGRTESIKWRPLLSVKLTLKEVVGRTNSKLHLRVDGDSFLEQMVARALKMEVRPLLRLELNPGTQDAGFQSFQAVASASAFIYEKMIALGWDRNLMTVGVNPKAVDKLATVKFILERRPLQDEQGLINKKEINQ